MALTRSRFKASHRVATMESFVVTAQGVPLIGTRVLAGRVTCHLEPVNSLINEREKRTFHSFY